MDERNQGRYSTLEIRVRAVEAVNRGLPATEVAAAYGIDRSTQKPERQYFELDEEAREEWMQTEAPKIRKTVHKYRALLYFQDEANVSLLLFWERLGHLAD